MLEAAAAKNARIAETCGPMQFYRGAFLRAVADNGDDLAKSAPFARFNQRLKQEPPDAATLRFRRQINRILDHEAIGPSRAKRTRIGVTENFVFILRNDIGVAIANERLHALAHLGLARRFKLIACRAPGNGVGVDLPETPQQLEIGKGRMIQKGARVAILSFGTRLSECEKAAESLAAKGITPTIADARFAKPLDRDMILQLATDHEALITIEEGSVGGFGSHVAQLLADNAVFDSGLKFRSMTLPDTFQNQDSPAAMYDAAGLSAKDIEAKVLETLGVASIADKRA